MKLRGLLILMLMGQVVAPAIARSRTGPRHVSLGRITDARRCP